MEIYNENKSFSRDIYQQGEQTIHQKIDTKAVKRMYVDKIKNKF